MILGSQDILKQTEGQIWHAGHNSSNPTTRDRVPWQFLNRVVTGAPVAINVLSLPGKVHR